MDLGERRYLNENLVQGNGRLHFKLASAFKVIVLQDNVYRNWRIYRHPNAS